MPRYRNSNRAARDAMYGMYVNMDDLGGYYDHEGGAGNYDTPGSVDPDSLGNDMNIGVSGSDNPYDGAGMAPQYSPDYPQEGGMGQSDGAQNRRPRRRPGNPYLENQ